MYFGQNRKKVLPMFYQLLPRKRVISAGLIFIGRTEKSCVENVPKVVIRKGVVAYGFPCALIYSR